MATRGDWKLGANGCRGASWSDERFWSQQLDDNSAIIWYAKKCTCVLLKVAL